MNFGQIFIFRHRGWEGIDIFYTFAVCFGKCILILYKKFGCLKQADAEISNYACKFATDRRRGRSLCRSSTSAGGRKLFLAGDGSERRMADAGAAGPFHHRHLCVRKKMVDAQECLHPGQEFPEEHP